MIDHHYFPENNFILNIFHGNLTSKEIHLLIDKLQKIDAPTGNMKALTIICENIKNVDISTSDIMEMGERMKEVSFRKNGKNAFIAETMLAFGLLRIYKVATDLFHLDELKIYRANKEDEAINWLSIPELKNEVEELLSSNENLKNFNVLHK